uniref:Uncharacterized protein n=1 Tax=Arion vulgaris TaxID=1028688 RepID=A0A0B7BM43_9EUPU
MWLSGSKFSHNTRVPGLISAADSLKANLFLLIFANGKNRLHRQKSMANY